MGYNKGKRDLTTGLIAAIWERAIDEKGLTIPFPNEKEAARIRYQLNAWRAAAREQQYHLAADADEFTIKLVTVNDQVYLKLDHTSANLPHLLQFKTKREQEFEAALETQVTQVNGHDNTLPIGPALVYIPRTKTGESLLKSGMPPEEVKRIEDGFAQ